jgi:hypothetical protein
MWLYFLGEVDFPMFRIHKLPLLIFSLLGYLTILFTLSGSVTPAYGQDVVPSVPSLGKGSYEVVLFADYFCPPCLRIDTKAEPLLKKLLATGAFSQIHAYLRQILPLRGKCQFRSKQYFSYP